MEIEAAWCSRNTNKVTGPPFFIAITMIIHWEVLRRTGIEIDSFGHSLQLEPKQRIFKCPDIAARANNQFDYDFLRDTEKNL